MERPLESGSVGGSELVQRFALGAKDRRLLRDHQAIIGIDEVGRGSLAGPVVVCGVRWSKIPVNIDVRDSKKVPAGKREQLSAWIRGCAQSWIAVEIWPEIIDRVNILEATRVAMRAAVNTLRKDGDATVVDAVDLGTGYESVLHPFRADDTFFSVATASIVAKHCRDELMKDLALEHPNWGWGQNKGYGTPAHRAAMAEAGRSYLHRKSFRLKSGENPG